MLKVSPELIQRQIERGLGVPKQIATLIGVVNRLMSTPDQPTGPVAASIQYFPERPDPEPPEGGAPLLFDLDDPDPEFPGGLRFKDPANRELGFVTQEERDAA